ncbi:hypothetical protein MSAN_01534600 [Mycena sanguinolenta]|uniref:Uncharacterized protein n=1 Tax=Mycena sanguinolenta TaxID=230812 RepID=A0A8H6Y544_9AGAR|nr:hypothetical protein MSAN_01534600 [Mycena sanguinolenta]
MQERFYCPDGRMAISRTSLGALKDKSSNGSVTAEEQREDPNARAAESTQQALFLPLGPASRWKGWRQRLHPLALSGAATLMSTPALSPIADFSRIAAIVRSMHSFSPRARAGALVGATLYLGPSLRAASMHLRTCHPTLLLYAALRIWSGEAPLRSHPTPFTRFTLRRAEEYTTLPRSTTLRRRSLCPGAPDPATASSRMHFLIHNRVGNEAPRRASAFFYPLIRFAPRSVKHPHARACAQSFNSKHLRFAPQAQALAARLLSSRFFSCSMIRPHLPRRRQPASAPAYLSFRRMLGPRSLCPPAWSQSRTHGLRLQMQYNLQPMRACDAFAIPKTQSILTRSAGTGAPAIRNFTCSPTASACGSGTLLALWVTRAP